MPFHYASDAVSVARHLLPAAGILTLLGIALLAFSLVKDRGIWYLACGAILLGLGIWQGSQYLKLSRSGGEWEIIVSADRTIWSAPSQSGENSFDLPLSEISHLQVTRFPDQSGRSNEYVLFAGANSYSLGKLSGVDLAEYAQALSQAGIEIREVTEEPAKK